MNSLWKDLLFLHGHIARKEDLVWHDETSAEPSQEELTDASATGGAGPTRDDRKPLKDCLSHWPRMAAPH